MKLIISLQLCCLTFLWSFCCSQDIEVTGIKKFESRYDIDTLVLYHNSKKIHVVEGKSKTFYNLYFNKLDSLLMSGSDENYSEIITTITYNPISTMYVVKWTTSQGKFIQDCEVDCLMKGNGTYNFNFAGVECKGIIASGTKNGVEFFSNEFYFGKRSFCSGKNCGEEIIFYSDQKFVSEYSYSSFGTRTFLLSYTFEGEILHFDNFNSKSTYEDGKVILKHRDGSQKIICEFKSNKLVGEVLLYNNNDELVSVFKVK